MNKEYILKCYNDGHPFRKGIKFDICGDDNDELYIIYVDPEWDKKNEVRRKTGKGKLYPLAVKMGIYEWIGNPEYKVVEVVSKDKKVRDDFWKEIKIKYGRWHEYDWLLAVKKRLTLKSEKQMLKGYWEEYLINILKEGE